MDERLKGKLTLYISGSQGVSPAECEVEYGIDFNTTEELENIFCEFIDENAMENIDNYLEDCDFNEDDAISECICDSGDFEIYLETDKPGKPSFIYESFIQEREE